MTYPRKVLGSMPTDDIAHDGFFSLSDDFATAMRGDRCHAPDPERYRSPASGDPESTAQALCAVFEQIAKNHEKQAHEQCHRKVLEYAPEKPDQEHEQDHISDIHIRNLIAALAKFPASQTNNDEDPQRSLPMQGWQACERKRRRGRFQPWQRAYSEGFGRRLQEQPIVPPACRRRVEPNLLRQISVRATPLGARQSLLHQGSRSDVEHGWPLRLPRS